MNDGPVGGEHAFWMGRRTRSVKQCDRRLRVHRIGEAGIALRSGKVAPSQRACTFACLRAHRHRRERPRFRRQQLQALLVDDQDAEAAVLDAVGHFLRRPPGVHGHCHRSHARDAHEAPDPFRVVAQRDAHPIAGRNAQGAQPRSHSARSVPSIGKGVALVPIDVERPVTGVERRSIQGAQIGWRLPEQAQGGAV